MIFYLITEDKENKYSFGEIRCSDAEFIETEISILSMPSSYRIRQSYSEVSFFTYSNGTIHIVLADNADDFCIVRFSSEGDYFGKYADGNVIILNKYDDEEIWYIKKENTKSDKHILNLDKSILMKGKSHICDIDGYICQGYFTAEETIELMFLDDSRMILGDFYFVNGPYWLEKTAYLFSVHEKKMTPAYFKKYWKTGNILQRGKILKELVIVLF